MRLTQFAVLFLAATLLASPAIALEPNDDYASATILAAGVVSVTDTIEGGEYPDTYLGAFADGTFALPALAVDDDSSPVGDGFGDGFFDLDVNPDGSIHLAVTGCCDDFDGTHAESGEYELYVDVFDSSGAAVDSFSVPSELFPGSIDEFSFDDPAWIGGTFDAYTDNALTYPVDPLDFWIFTGLTSGEPFVAETSTTGVGNDFDTLLALLDENGEVDNINDDHGGDSLFSRLVGVVPASGEVALAVTGYADFDLVGLHSETGDYTLTVTVGVPEPNSLLLAAFGLALLPGCRKRFG